MRFGLTIVVFITWKPIRMLLAMLLIHGLSLGLGRSPNTLYAIHGSSAQLFNGSVWVPIANMRTNAGGHPALISLSHPNGRQYLYSISGDGSGERYDPVTNTWTDIATMKKTSRSQMAAAALTHPDGKQYIYVLGGGFSGSTSAERYDPVLNSWNYVANMHQRRVHGAACSLTHSDGKEFLYAISGYVDSGVVERYNASDNTWAYVASLSSKRYRNNAASLKHSNGKSYIYAVGGAGGPDSSNHGPSSIVERYDSSNNTWTIVASLQTKRSLGGLTVLSDILGQEFLYAVGGGSSSTVEKFDSSTGSWAFVPDMSLSGTGLGYNEIKAAVISGLCARGFYYVNANQACNICPAGYVCDPGTTNSSKQDMPCPPGFVCDAGSSSLSKRPCPAGFVCDFEGTTSLMKFDVICPLGFVCGAGSTSHTMDPCPAGYFCDIGTTPLSKQICPPSYMCEEGSSNSTKLICPGGLVCDAGSHPNNTHLCPIGFVCPQGTTSATEKQHPCPRDNVCDFGTSPEKLVSCPPGFICPGGNSPFSSSCRASICPRQVCPARSQFNTLINLCECEKGAFLVEAKYWGKVPPSSIDDAVKKNARGDVSHFFGSLGSFGAACALCNDRRDCSETNTTRLNSFPLPGFYPIDTDNMEFDECFYSQACQQTPTFSSSSKQLCSASYSGLLCAQCSPGFFRSVDFSCNKCSDNSMLSAFGFAGMFIVFVIVMAFLVHSNNKGARKPASPTSVLQKIFLNSLQVNSLSVNLDVPWPSLASNYLSIFTFVGQAGSSALALDCQLQNPSDAFFYRCAMMAIAPIVVVPSLVVLYKLKRSCKKFKFFKRSLKPSSKQSVAPQQAFYSPTQFDDTENINNIQDTKRLSDRVISATLVLMTFIHPDVSRSMLLLFLCIPAHGTTYLQMNTSIECWAGTHTTWILAMAVPILIMFVVGFPVVIYFALTKAHIKDTLHKEESNQSLLDEDLKKIDRYSFIVKGYKPRFWYWELLVTGQKLLLMVISVFFARGGSSQVITAVIVVMLFLWLQTLFQPYDTAHLNRVATLSCICSLLLLLVGQYTLDRVDELNSTHFHSLTSHC